jgi:hypothetical protein
LTIPQKADRDAKTEAKKQAEAVKEKVRPLAEDIRLAS